MTAPFMGRFLWEAPDGASTVEDVLIALRDSMDPSVVSFRGVTIPDQGLFKIRIMTISRDGGTTTATHYGGYRLKLNKFDGELVSTLLNTYLASGHPMLATLIPAGAEFTVDLHGYEAE